MRFSVCYELLWVIVGFSWVLVGALCCCGIFLGDCAIFWMIIGGCAIFLGCSEPLWDFGGW